MITNHKLTRMRCRARRLGGIPGETLSALWALSRLLTDAICWG
jgi:hypothetical protein